MTHETLERPRRRLLTEPFSVQVPVRFWRVLAELVAAAVVATVVSLAAQWIVARLRVPMPSYTPQAAITLVAGALVLGGLWLATRSAFRVTGRLVAWAGISALVSAIQSLMLVGTKFYLAGVTGDNLFRQEYLTRLRDTAGFSDFAYPDMPAYYPRGWFWLAGRAAALLNIPAWEIYKPFAIVTMAVGTVLAFVAWCLVLKPGVAVLVSLAVSTVAVGTFAANEPYTWLFCALIPPLAVVAWRYVAERGRGYGTPVLLGVYTGLVGLTYTLLCGFFVLTVVVAAVAGLVLKRERFRVILGKLVLIGLVALPLMALQWVPFYATALGKPTENGFLWYLPEAATVFPLYHYPTGFAGVLGLFGIVWSLLRLRHNTVARGMTLVLACGYGWYALSFVVTFFDANLMPYKVDLVLEEALRGAGVLALLDGVRWLHRRLADRWRPGALLVVAVLSVISVVGQLQQAPSSIRELVDGAYRDYYPSGTTPLGERDPAKDGAWNQQLHDEVAQLTGKPEHDLVVLSTYQEFLSFWPYWSFQASKVEYANPLAMYDERRLMIEHWTTAASPDALLTEMRSSGLRLPDVFVLRTEADGLHLTLTRNVFPAAADNISYDVVFPTRLFDSAQFTERQVGPFTIVVRR